MAIQIIKLTPDRYKTTAWSGGTTTQLRIYPPGADYAGRSFLWRISSALVKDETSVFTPLPDYRRLISTLQGDIVLRHDGGEPIFLRPFEVHAFDGGADTACTGRCRDFNLMLRKGNAEGSLEAVALAPGQDVFVPAPEEAGEVLLYCAEGSCTLLWSGQSLTLDENEAAVLRRPGDGSEAKDPDGPVTLSAKTGVWLMIARMRLCSPTS